MIVACGDDHNFSIILFSEIKCGALSAALQAATTRMNSANLRARLPVCLRCLSSSTLHVENVSRFCYEQRRLSVHLSVTARALLPPTSLYLRCDVGLDEGEC